MYSQQDFRDQTSNATLRSHESTHSFARLKSIRSPTCEMRCRASPIPSLWQPGVFYLDLIGALDGTLHRATFLCALISRSSDLTGCLTHEAG